MRIPQLAVVAALALAAPQLLAQNAAPMLDTTAYTAAATALRAEPQPAARVLTNLPAGWPVRVGSCTGGWCTARTGSLAGYLPADSLTLSVPPGAAAAAATAATPGTSVGVDLTTRLTIGFAVGPKLRLAPELSYVSQGNKSYGTNSQIGNYIVDGSDTELWLGLGIYYVAPLAVRPLGAPCLLYFGPRVGLAVVRSKTKVENPTIPSEATVKRTDFWAGIVTGSELVVSPHFSVGAEAQVTKVFLGSTSVLGVTSSSPGVAQGWVDLETRGTLVLRFYP
jgi:hypothetical protein